MSQGVNNFNDYMTYLKSKNGGYIDVTLRDILNININPKCDKDILPDKVDKDLARFLPVKNKPFLVLDFELINNLVDAVWTSGKIKSIYLHSVPLAVKTYEKKGFITTGKNPHGTVEMNMTYWQTLHFVDIMYKLFKHTKNMFK